MHRDEPRESGTDQCKLSPPFCYYMFTNNCKKFDVIAVLLTSILYKLILMIVRQWHFWLLIICTVSCSRLILRRFWLAFDYAKLTKLWSLPSRSRSRFTHIGYTFLYLHRFICLSVCLSVREVYGLVISSRISAAKCAKWRKCTLTYRSLFQSATQCEAVRPPEDLCTIKPPSEHPVRTKNARNDRTHWLFFFPILLGSRTND